MDATVADGSVDFGCMGTDEISRTCKSLLLEQPIRLRNPNCCCLMMNIMLSIIDTEKNDVFIDLCWYPNNTMPTPQILLYPLPSIDLYAGLLVVKDACIVPDCSMCV